MEDREKIVGKMEKEFDLITQAKGTST